jgi:hypothetical protein
MPLMGTLLSLPQQCSNGRLHRGHQPTWVVTARLTYRQRYEQSTGRDPFRCPHCGELLEVWRIWHPTYGVIYDEGEVIKRGTYASTAPRAGP